MEPQPEPPRIESPDEFATRAHVLHRRRMRNMVVVLLAGAGVLLLICGGGAWYGYHRIGIAQDEAEFAQQLKMTGLAAHGFHTTHDHFPPHALNPRKRHEIAVPLSFQTRLLPHLGHGSVYESIDKTLPWDNTSNVAYKSPLKVFLSPKHEIKHTTSGHGATFIVPNSRMMAEGVGLSIPKITDGTTNTIMAGGIDETSVPAWGDPNNGRDPANGFAGGAKAFGGYSWGGAQILLGDGSVREISANVSPKIAKALATPAAGDVVGDY